ncbi:carbohydrate ABC transporter permease [Actinoplanes sp. TBRC 11911]|uniref:carbohydrate ABC transporter permease n=1 Tax=Actinoplanes sp. TBRC 11911 TaxID=2729386 RepID=UPI00145FBF17|nr:carbohydrate ABC transporter permease [Actinoplanes sp. TBRC 11911]NMO55672.1 carbohydrate ABC transporter permease [Actinoplanes sp. TBRC 11911]
MTTAVPLPTATAEAAAAKVKAAEVAKKKLSSPWASFAVIVIALLWTIPTFGLLVSSFRPERQIKTTGWWTFFSDPTLTLDNYRSVFGAEGGVNMADFFVNSLVICIPAVLIPLSLAALAAYAFAWIDFPAKNVLFLVIFALQIVPIQVTLLPLLKLFVSWDLSGTFWTLWLAHSTFALPLAIYLLHNFMREIPSGLIEAARVDGAGHVSIFFHVMLPLLTPALAAFGIFQFLWVWNDLLVALVFAGGGNEVAPTTLALANLSGTRGTAWHLLSAGAFVSIIVPVTVFLLLQRYFVRGLLAGSVKG